MSQTDSYKLTDLDYLIGDHRLQMMKAALPFLSLPQQRALSLAVKFQELRRTYRLFPTRKLHLWASALWMLPRNRISQRNVKSYSSLRKSQRTGVY